MTELPVSKHPRFVVTCNFSTFLVYDMEQPGGEPEEILLENLETDYYRLSFLTDSENVHLKREMELSLAAGEIVGLLYDAFLKQYVDPTSERSLKSLNMLCVRLVFCLYAEDAGIFGKHSMFHDYMAGYEVHKMRKALIELFHVLDTKPEDRDPYLKDDDPILAAFPYVNGGLFTDEDIEIPQFTEEIRSLLLAKASDDFNWAEISPTIFGAVFESTLNPETRRSGGMHYTSIENIHKVIDPLFLDNLRNEFQTIKEETIEKTRNKRLAEFQDKLASLKFLDPACGSGNFLTETYLSLRRMENEAVALMTGGQISLGEVLNPIKVSIGQFYGIEINDFAATVAKTALWIAESQMMKETEDIVHTQLDFLPLKAYANITEGNALRTEWESVVPKHELNYIMGNPPFVGARLMKPEQKGDLIAVFDNKKNCGNLDYVSAWYKKAVGYITRTDIECAFVSTNSITQGEQAGLLWSEIMQNGININFAYRTFKWNSEAAEKAAVHCVIIGFSYINRDEKVLFLNETGTKHITDNINAYLVEAPNVFISSRKQPLQNVPEMEFGSMANDGGFLCNYSDEDKNDVVYKYPKSEKMFKRFLGATEFLHNKSRWCLWLKGISPTEIKEVPPVFEAVQKVKEMRASSNREATRKLADTPMLFGEIRQPEEDYLLVPRHSSENRRYIPIGYVSRDIICGDANMLIPNANLYYFGVLTSNVHMAWMRTVCGRLEMRYRYSATIVYNNFPWCEPTEEQKAYIEKTAQGILDARAMYPNSPLADLYDEIAMPPELRKAHQENDKAVMRAYGLSPKDEAFKSESACVAMLMKLYKAKAEQVK